MKGQEGNDKIQNEIIFEVKTNKNFGQIQLNENFGKVKPIEILEK